MKSQLNFSEVIQVRYTKNRGHSVTVKHWSEAYPEHGKWPLPSQQNQNYQEEKCGPHLLLGEYVRFVDKVKLDKDKQPSLMALQQLEHIPKDMKAKYDYYLLLVSKNYAFLHHYLVPRRAAMNPGYQNLSRRVWCGLSGA